MTLIDCAPYDVLPWCVRRFRPGSLFQLFADFGPWRACTRILTPMVLRTMLPTSNIYTEWMMQYC
jgi:hypothetical protein